MYYQAISQCVQSLRNMEPWLDKADALARERRFDIAVLMNARLAVDMGPLTYQIQSACDYVKGAAAWLSGQHVPKHEDLETSPAELRERIDKTVRFVEGISVDEYAEAGSRTVSVSYLPAGKAMSAENYLLQIAIPNVYFHVSMAYAILRHHGVGVGKMEFLGPLKTVDEHSLPSHQTSR
jgi:hypothetical protein